MKSNHLPLVAGPLALSFALLISPLEKAAAQALSASQLDAIEKQLQEIQSSADQRYSALHSSSGDMFLSAAGDPKKAIELYLNCTKEVEYDREGRDEADFRAWRDSGAVTARLDDDAFIESLQIQLLYLGISCKAAEAEDIETVFPRLMQYVDGLSNLSELPKEPLTSGVSGSIFVKAYRLENLLRNNESWEETPLSISGIYEKTILPHLREEKPSGLMAAWDRRIEQQTRLAAFIDSAQEKELEGDRDAKRRQLDAQKRFENSRNGEIFRAHDKNDFLQDTLPNLHWSKLKDQYKYVSQVAGAQAMLKFLGNNKESDHIKKWIDEMRGLMAESAESNPVVSTPAPIDELPAPAATPTGPNGLGFD